MRPLGRKEENKEEKEERPQACEIPRVMFCQGRMLLCQGNHVPYDSGSQRRGGEKEALTIHPTRSGPIVLPPMGDEEGPPPRGVAWEWPSFLESHC